eukprot:CAMPEP_0115733596 /NCGR_PEP_ID=MMETSP0272-20121206/85745_1 /TAXON_ID=71861 /ORGANISM="Scrippsiella trochoidea, Strain CCMP3099" /LENGTH=49 /DNA_ID= /DNA_START= /DNA_END= /DNA_ORIENTATION=
MSPDLVHSAFKCQTCPLVSSSCTKPWHVACNACSASALLMNFTNPKQRG